MKTEINDGRLETHLNKEHMTQEDYKLWLIAYREWAEKREDGDTL